MRWPTFTGLARVHGLVGAHSEPLRIRDRVAGAITWYSRTVMAPEVFDLRGSATAVAAFLTPAVHRDRAGQDRRDSTRTLLTAARIVGIWMGRDAHEALPLLHRLAGSKGIAVEEQAETIVDCALRSAWQIDIPDRAPRPCRFPSPSRHHRIRPVDDPRRGPFGSALCT